MKAVGARLPRYDGLALKGLARWSQAYTWKAADYVLPVTQVLVG